MKRNIFITILSVCLIVCTVGFAACQQENGAQDYDSGDAKIDTTLSYDIAEKIEAFYIGSSAITSVTVNGEPVPETDYILRNNYLLMPDDWYQTLGAGNHVLTVVYKKKSLDFNFVITDSKPLVYELPVIDKSYVPEDEAELSAVIFPVPSQEKQVEYSITDKNGNPVAFTLQNDVIKLENVTTGDYAYSVKATRFGATAIDESYSFKVVSREVYEGVIDVTSGDINRDTWYVKSTANSFGYRDYTDKNGTTRGALYFERNSGADDYTRAIGINRDILIRLLKLGYTKIGFWYCLDYETLTSGVTLGFYRDGDSWAYTEITPANVWTYAEADISKVVNLNNLLNDNNSNFVVGFMTRNYDSTSKKNKPLTAYFSEIVATGRKGDASGYLGSYSCGNENITLGENGVAAVNGENKTFWIGNGRLVIDYGNRDYRSYAVDKGVIVDETNGKVFVNASVELAVIANTETVLADSFPNIVASGIKHNYFVYSDGVSDGLAKETFRFSVTGSYEIMIDLRFGSAKIKVNVSLPVSTGNLAYTLESSGKAYCYLANNQQTGQLFHYGTENKLYFNCFNPSLANAIIFDDDFVKECFENGLYCIKVTYYVSNIDSNAWVRIAPALYDSVNKKFTQFSCAESTGSLKKGETVTIVWQLTEQEVQSIDFANGNKLAISGLAAGSGEKTQVVFSHFEFCAPES